MANHRLFSYDKSEDRRIAMLEIGTKAPDFTLPDQNGNLHSPSGYRGKKVILYFYPKDNTAGCTKLARACPKFRPILLRKPI